MVHQCAALMSCLNGDLAMLGANGQLVLRTLGNPEKVNLDNTSIPMQLAVQAALKQASLVESQSPAPAIIDEGYEAEQAASHAANVKASSVVTPTAIPKTCQTLRPMSLRKLHLVLQREIAFERSCSTN